MNPDNSGGGVLPMAGPLQVAPLFFIQLSSLLGSFTTVSPRSIVAIVERVTDGDTLIVITENRTKLRIRLLGIDIPEIPRGAMPDQHYRGRLRRTWGR